MSPNLINSCAALLFGLSTSVWGAACVAPPDGLISWWPGEGSASDIIGSNNGTLVNGVPFVKGMVGNAFSLRDNTAAHVSVPSSPSLNVGTSDFSMDAWIKTDSRKHIQTIQDKREGPHAVGYHFFLQNDPYLGMQINDPSGSTQATAFLDILDGRYHHVAVSVRRNLKDGIRLYVDGVSVNATVNSDLRLRTDLDNSAPFLIGGHSYDNDVNSFDGVIDEFEFFNRALSDAEVKAIYDAGSAGKCKAGAFAEFTPRAEFTLGPKANDDSYWVRGWLKLADTSNGINPLTEAVTIKVGPFSHTLPAGSFVQHGSAFTFKGPVGPSTLDVRITPSSYPGGYSFKSCLKNGSLGATTMEPEVQLTIGDDQGQATLDVGYAKFGKGSNGENWVFPPAQ